MSRKKIREKSGNFEVNDKWQPCNEMEGRNEDKRVASSESVPIRLKPEGKLHSLISLLSTRSDLLFCKLKVLTKFEQRHLLIWVQVFKTYNIYNTRYFQTYCMQSNTAFFDKKMRSYTSHFYSKICVHWILFVLEYLTNP